MLKTIVRGILFVISIPYGGEFTAWEGTRWDRFLSWAYGRDAAVPLFSVQWPEE